jgi:DNA-binding transcriptional MerR regulator
MPSHDHAPQPRDLVRIDEAARMLGRSVETVRKWSQRRPAILTAYRDGVTKIRFFDRADVERLRPRAER